MDRKVPEYFIVVMLSWFLCSVSSVKWGRAFSAAFTVLAGVCQGRLLSTLLFSVYMDVLILRESALGCKLQLQYFGCLLYADDIILLSHSINAMRSMLRICEQFAVDFNVKFTSSNSMVMCIGERFSVNYTPLTLNDSHLEFVPCLTYLGVSILPSKQFKCCVNNARMRFYRSFNSIYFRSKGANSEHATVHLHKSYCSDQHQLYFTRHICSTMSETAC